MSQDLSQALATARRALAILERQAAGYTSLTIPAHLQIELEEKRAEVAKLEARLRGAGAPDNAPASGGRDHTHVEGGMFMGPVTVRGDMAGRDIININLPQKKEPAISPGTPEWDAAIEHYRQRIRKHYGATRVLGKHEPVSLEGIYTDVYLLDEPRAAIHGETRGKRLEGEAAVLHTDDLHFVVLGKPGGGKTTFLKHLALHVDYPIFITLREWARSGLDLRAFITEEMAICGLNDIIAETWLREGTAVLLLDGLDEISEDAQRRLDLDRFIRGYPGCRILLTCRGAATPYRSEHFKYVEVADFTDEQVEAFAERWFGDGSSADFCAEIKQNPHIRDLSRTPLLLGMLCLTYEKRGAFPEKRAKLYQRALDALLVEWDESRGIERDAMRRAGIYHQLSLGRKHQMFARIAYETFEQGETLIPQEHLEQRLLDYLVTVPDAPERIDIDAKAVLKAIEAQHGILIEFSPRVYAFSHPTFQEYYAARYVVEQAEAGDEQALSRFLAHVHEDRWREVILLAASMFSTADAFFEVFGNVLDAYIAGDAKLVDLMTWAAAKADSVDAPYQAAAIRSYYVDFARDLALALDLARVLDRDLARDLARTLARDLDRDRDRLLAFVRDRDRALARDLDRDRAFDRDLDRDLVFDLDRVFDLDLARDLDRDRAFDRDLDRDLDLDLDRVFDLDRVLARDLDRDRVFDLDRVLARDRAFDRDRDLARDLARDRVLARVLVRDRALAIAIDLAKDMGLITLHHGLSALALPDLDAPPEAHRDFRKKLQALMLEHRNIGHDWELTTAQSKTLEKYFTAARLLVECLDVAYVTDRAAIEDRLVRPPQEEDASV